jgi:subtilisin family serine protease
VVAVLDTGITSHPDLAGQTVAGYDMISDPSISNDGDGRDANPSDPGDYYWDAYGNFYPSSWHGTHVAGTIAARTDNGTGVAGVAPLAKVQPVRVLGAGGGYTSDIAAGIYWAAGLPVAGTPINPTPAKVINMSLGGYYPYGCPAVEQDAINAATAHGTTVVVAAGNDDDYADYYSPANCDNVVTVSAIGPAGYSAYYSNYGSKVDLAAPGGDMNYGSSGGILSTLNSGTTTPASPIYQYYEGTSMAAPHVAGAIAQLLSVQPGLTPAQVKARLKATARPLSTCSAFYCGAGLLDAAALIPAPNPWQQVPGTARDIGLGGGASWAIGTNPVAGGYGIYRWNGTNWTVMPGAGVRISVDQAGRAWVVNSAGSIYRWTGGGWQHLPGAGTDIGVGANGTAWAIGTNPVAGGHSIYRWYGTNWGVMPGAGLRVDVDQAGRAWVVNSAGRIYRFI